MLWGAKIKFSEHIDEGFMCKWKGVTFFSAMNGFQCKKGKSHDKMEFCCVCQKSRQGKKTSSGPTFFTFSCHVKCLQWLMDFHGWTWSLKTRVHVFCSNGKKSNSVLALRESTGFVQISFPNFSISKVNSTCKSNSFSNYVIRHQLFFRPFSDNVLNILWRNEKENSQCHMWQFMQGASPVLHQLHRPVCQLQSRLAGKTDH